MRWIVILLALTSCGPDQQEEFKINGELKQCQIIDSEPCGLRIACDDDQIYRCVTN